MNLESTAVDSHKYCLLSLSIAQNIKLIDSNHHPKYFNAFMNACFCSKNWVQLNIAGSVYCILSLHKALSAAWNMINALMPQYMQR